MGAMKREKVVKVRFSDAEFDELVRIAQNNGERQVARYVRNVALSSDSLTQQSEQPYHQDQQVDVQQRSWRDELAWQVRRIGVNINQIARSLNANSSLSASEKVKLLAALESLRLAVEDLNSKGRQ